MSPRAPLADRRLQNRLLAGLARGLLRAPGWTEAEHCRSLMRLRATWSRLPEERRRELLGALAGTPQAAPLAHRIHSPASPADRRLLQACRAIAHARRLPFIDESPLLTLIGRDRYGRRHWLRPATARALGSLRAAAESDGITLEVVSSFRSIADQLRIIRRKLARGETLAEILVVNAPPGCSEHHGGGAVDFAVPGGPVLTEDFEASPAFAWLQAHAGRFGFSLSYPRGNRHGYIHEPWHWCHGQQKAPRQGPDPVHIGT
jgi:zinc D-Ala-D-Ala carboxypeptidase